MHFMMNKLFVAVLVIMPVLVQAQAPLVGRPVLFVHGWCGEAADWSTIEPITIQYLQRLQPGLYPRSANYDLYFDGRIVRTWPDGKDIASAGLPSNARFFSINFYDFLHDADPSAFNPVRTTSVANVSVLNKADELARVIAVITSLTHVRDVIVIGHSMGGLVARAYLENQGVSYGTATCSDTELPAYSSRLLKNVPGHTWPPNIAFPHGLTR
jgi:pimeloyl-ACP methyl ester carboxylesterase